MELTRVVRMPASDGRSLPRIPRAIHRASYVQAWRSGHRSRPTLSRSACTGGSTTSTTSTWAGSRKAVSPGSRLMQHSAWRAILSLHPIAYPPCEPVRPIPIAAFNRRRWSLPSPAAEQTVAADVRPDSPAEYIVVRPHAEEPQPLDGPEQNRLVSMSHYQKPMTVLVRAVSVVILRATSPAWTRCV